MIEIRRNITNNKIDELYSQLTKELAAGDKVDLQLPKAIDNGDFGLLFSVLQFVATWLRSSKSGSLRVPINDSSEYKNYLFQQFVYPCVVLCWEKEILDLNNKNIRPDLKGLSKEYFKKMDFFELDENESVPVYCFDHDLSKRGYSRAFYEIQDKVVPEAILDFTLHHAFTKIGGHLNRKVFNDSISEKLNSFYSIIHELFNNTDEHARTDENGYNLYPNIRALYLKFHRKPIAKYQEIYKDNPGLLNYFKSEFSLNDNGELYLLEISVLDSGPGLVKRFENISDLNMTAESEVLSIKKCLYQGNTSATGMEKERRGVGLDRVLQTIDNKGFVKIRSGRVEVFRDMKNNRYSKSASADQIKLYDWDQNTDDFFKIKPEVAGTLISIIYPIDFKK